MMRRTARLARSQDARSVSRCFRPAVVSRVMPRAAPGVGGAPLRGDPSAPEQPLQGGVEGARLHVEDVARQLRDALADAPAVHGLQVERLQDQHVERALQEFLGVVWHERMTDIL